MPIIGIDPTPNPNSVKISFDRKVAEKATTFGNAAAAKDDPIAAALLSVDGVVSVFMVNNFASITKRPDADWNALMPLVQEALTAAGA